MAEYRIERDGLADLALELHVEEELRELLGVDPQLGVDLEDAINAKLTEHGVTDDGEWLGDWSSRQIVDTAIRDHHSRMRAKIEWTITIGDSEPTVVTGARAAVEAINAYGNDHGDPTHYNTSDLYNTAQEHRDGWFVWGPVVIADTRVTAKYRPW